ncbi:hypothetical protein ACHAQJ_001206 [Trichoderma viride]
MKAVAAANKVAAILNEKQSEIASNVTRTSPWGVYAEYQAAAIHVRLMSQSNTLKSLEALDTLRQSLKVLDTRWKLGGTYLQMLEVWEVTSMP